MNDRPAPTPPTGKKTLWAWTVATFFGVGLLKPGPGTWGSVAAVLLWTGGALLLHPGTSYEWWASGVHPNYAWSDSGFVLTFYALATLGAVIFATALGV